jgi:hypothetical protein
MTLHGKTLTLKYESGLIARCIVALSYPATYLMTGTSCGWATARES